jgi:hypothetical protein
MDAASHMKDEKRKPKPDDVSLCMSCGELLVFTADLSMRLPTPAELQSMNPATRREIARIRAAIKQVVPAGGLARRENEV